jgi:hypothetical protein
LIANHPFKWQQNVWMPFKIRKQKHKLLIHIGNQRANIRAPRDITGAHFGFTTHGDTTIKVRNFSIPKAKYAINYTPKIKKTTSNHTQASLNPNSLDINSLLDVPVEELDLSIYLKNIDVKGIKLGSSYNSVKTLYAFQLQQRQRHQDAYVLEQGTKTNMSVTFGRNHRASPVSKIVLQQNLGRVTEKTCNARMDTLTSQMSKKYGSFETIMSRENKSRSLEFFNDPELENGDHRIQFRVDMECHDTFGYKIHLSTNFINSTLMRIQSEKTRRNNPEVEASF